MAYPDRTVDEVHEHLARTLDALTRTIVGAKGAHRDSLCKVAGLLSHAADELMVARDLIRPARPAGAS